MGYQIGRSFAGLTAAASFLVVIASLFFALIAAGAASRSTADHSIPPGWFVVVAFVAMFICASCFCMLAIFDIADRLCSGPIHEPVARGIPLSPIEKTPAHIDERAPTPADGYTAIEEVPVPTPEEDRDAVVARRLAEYEASKKK
jgi:hypothetical protein